MKIVNEKIENQISKMMEWDEDGFTEADMKLPLFSLAKMGRPEYFTDAVARQKKQERNLFFIEPFSLEKFSYASLSGEKYSKY